MASEDQDKSEEATPFKLDEARRRGQVAKSMDVNSVLMLTGALGLLTVWGMNFVREGLSIERAIFDQAASLQFNVSDLMVWFSSIAFAVAKMFVPLFVMVVVIAILSNVLQTGPVFSFFPIKPDLKRLNPIEGFKRIFSMRLLFEAGKTFLKLLLVGGVAYAVIVDIFPLVITLLQTDPRAYPQLLLDGVISLVFKLVLVLLLIAILDFIFSRREYAKKMRMSKREMKDEHKRREGDPQVRAKIKELQREMAQRAKSAKRVPDADVLITNPTHFAIALKYERGTMQAPRVIAKGVGEAALNMRALASRHGVPVLERPSLARQLYRDVDIDHAIPENAYEAVARIYAELYAAPTGVVRVGVEVKS